MDKYSDIISDGGLDPRNATPQPAAHPFSCICDECCKKPAQASEPVAVVEDAEYQSDNAILNIPLTIGTKLFTAQQPAAECLRCAELEKLQWPKLTEKWIATCAENADLQAKLTALRAENEGLRKDAERYRWLRSKDTGPGKIWELIGDDCQPNYMTLKHSEELDAAIDAELKEKP